MENTEEYEREITCLKTHLIRRNIYSTMGNYDRTCAEYRLANQVRSDEEKYRVFLEQLQEEFQRVDALVSQANTMATEMQKPVLYKTIVHIPVTYLKSTERNIAYLCQVAVQVKQGDMPSSIWDMKKFESKFNDMKDLYQRWKTSNVLPPGMRRMNPFFEKESEILIGVANIYLKALFYNSKLDYIVPIINTQGEIKGSLRVVLDQSEFSAHRTLANCQINSTTQGSISEGIGTDVDEESFSSSQVSLEDEGIEELSVLSNANNDQITVKFSIKEIRDLPKTIAEQILCRYTFINPKLDQTILSNSYIDSEQEKNSRRFVFDHENEYTFPINDDFLSTCRTGAVSIEVYSQYSSKEQSDETPQNKQVRQRDAGVREISERWKSVKRHVQLSLEIQELDATGQWGAVDVDVRENILSGGIYRLKQGQSKRLVAQLRVIPRSDPMPLTFHAIQSVKIGSISTRKIDAPIQLDSYQDEDLKQLRSAWLNLIETEKTYHESQINALNQQTKTSYNKRKETALLDQLVRLADERNIAMFPPPASGIPGAPASWMPPPTVEMHRPLIFLDAKTSTEIAGLHATLSDEEKTKMFTLPLIQQATDENRVIALWDPTIHESTDLNQVTSTDTLIYLIVKINVLITEPTQMEIVLRKRIAVTISKTERWWPGKVLRDFISDKSYKCTSVVYEIVSTIPRSIQPMDDHSQNIPLDLIDDYLQHAIAIDSLVLLDRLRQEFHLAENCAKQHTIKKSKSVPDMLSKKRRKELFHSPATSRRKNVNEPLPLIESELADSTPSMTSRRSFIEEQFPALSKSSFEIKQPIDLEENPSVEDESTLALKYIIPSTPNSVIKEEDVILSPPSLFVEERDIITSGPVVDESGVIPSSSPVIEEQTVISPPSPVVEEKILIPSAPNPIVEERTVAPPSPVVEQENVLSSVASSVVEEENMISPPNSIVEKNNDDLAVGSRVTVNTGHSVTNKLGTVRFVGPISVREGLWYGVELDEAVGKNNGSIGKHVYFQCAENHGIFVRPDKIRRMNAEKAT